jgi:hypothetical protein
MNDSLLATGPSLRALNKASVASRAKRIPRDGRIRQTRRLACQARCTQCSETFQRVQDLCRHMNSLHNPDQPHYCHQCRRSFGRADHLKRHIPTHDSIEVFELSLEALGILSATEEESKAAPEPEVWLTPSYQCDAGFQALAKRFVEDFNLHFPDVPCPHCGVLCLKRDIKWKESHPDINFEARDRFDLTCVTRSHSETDQIAVCRWCFKRPRPALPQQHWPDVLMNTPPRSRIFLSPLQLNSNLGRTHSAHPNTS